MREAIITYLPWLLSAITIWMTLLAGNKTRWAWLIGLCNQVLWAAWIITSESWGLAPMCLALTVVYARNHIRWNVKEPQALPGLTAAQSAHVRKGYPL
jgi:hypothetical protein